MFSFRLFLFGFFRLLKMFPRQTPRIKITRNKSQFHLSDRRVSTGIVFLLATGIFGYHAFTIIGRHLQEDVNESIEGKRNSSLILPTVQMQFETTRDEVNGNVEAKSILKRMTFRAVLDNNKVQPWAYHIAHDDDDGVHSITLNTVWMPVKIFVLEYLN